MGVNKIIMGITAGILLLVFLFIYLTGRNERNLPESSGMIVIEKKWQLPEELEEVSGITYLENDRVACIQDEDGEIFIYDLRKSRMERKIQFAGSGDYEGITVAGTTAYVVRSDGTLFEIADFETAPLVRKIETWLKRKQDVEGLTYDREQDRLLFAIKDDDPVQEERKGIFAFDRKKRKLSRTPVYNLDLKDPLLDTIRESDIQDTFKPSEVNIHPVTGDILLLDGRKPMLLILDRKSKTKALYILDEQDFPQPEGLTFDKEAHMYISSEGDPGTIQLVTITKE